MTPATLHSMEMGEEYVAPQRRRWAKFALAVGAACAFLLVGFITISCTMSFQAFVLGIRGQVKATPIKAGPIYNAKMQVDLDPQVEFEDSLKVLIHNLEKQHEKVLQKESDEALEFIGKLEKD